MDTNAAVQLFMEYDSDKPETLFPEEEPIWSPVFEHTQIRSLNLTHGVDRKFWIYVPVLKMCPFLGRLELQIKELEGLVPVLRECLHSSCPLLKVLKIVRELPRRVEHVPLNWSLGLLCPGVDERSGGASAMETFKPISPLYRGETPAINRDLVYGMETPPSSKARHHNCFGFRLKTFQLSGRNRHKQKIAVSNYPRPWHHLLNHHGQSLTTLDVSPIVMPLQEFVDMASAGDQMPHLLSLDAVVVWTVDEQKSLSAAVLTERRSCHPAVFQLQPQDQCYLLPQQRLGGTKHAWTEALLESVGLRPWTACRGLLKLELKINQNEPKNNELAEERVLLEYLVHEICQSSALEKLAVRTDDIPWLPVMTLPGPAKCHATDVPANSTTTATAIASGVQAGGEDESRSEDIDDGGEIGEEVRVGGYLDQFSSLRWLKEMTWI